jgi:hypothetical protein
VGPYEGRVQGTGYPLTVMSDAMVGACLRSLVGSVIVSFILVHRSRGVCDRGEGVGGCS